MAKTQLSARTSSALEKEGLMPLSSERVVEKAKVPLENKDSFNMRVQKQEGTDKKKEIEQDVTVKKVASSSPLASEKESRVSSSPTPVAFSRPRQIVTETAAPAKRDSADLEVIKLPSVKQLAQQFNVGPLHDT